MEWIIQLPILFFSVMFHEVSHGWVALRNGDGTALRAGRLSFNPLRHVDPIGSFALPLFCVLAHIPPIGWAKPVPVNPAGLRGARWALVRVAMVGPVSNLVLGLAAALAFRAASSAAMRSSYQETILGALLFMVQINLMLAFFNLIPVHPLDGSKVLSGLLPSWLKANYERHQPFGFMIILLLIYLGMMRPLVTVPATAALGALARAGLLW